jgi:transcriptional regulator with XRE-family HTH domain
MARPQRAKGEHRVANWQGVARALRHIMRTEKLNQSALASRLGVHRSMVSRLLRGRQGVLGGRTFRAIRDMLSTDAERVVFETAVFGPEQQLALKPYVEWLRSELQRYGVPEHYRANALLRPDPGDCVARPSVLIREDEPADPHLLRGLWARGLVAVLRRERLYRKHFKDFDDWVAKQWGRGTPETMYRGLVAECQVVEPLVATSLTGGVECSVDELHAAGRLGAYLSSAFKAQRTLLRRGRALDRIRQGGGTGKGKRGKR